MKILLACSSGGHFIQLYSLKEFWQGYDRVWVTFPGNDTNTLLMDENVHWAHHPTNRNIPNFFKNLSLARKILKQENPDRVITTGAGVGVPFIYIAKMMGIKTIFIESLTRISHISLSGRLVYFVADEFLVQWPELAKKYKRSKFTGQVI